MKWSQVGTKTAGGIGLLILLLLLLSLIPQVFQHYLNVSFR